MSDKIPAWALEALGITAEGAWDDCERPYREIAALLVATREKALREAAALFPGNADVTTSILALIDREPTKE